jgi:hypothetical protein
MHFSPNNFLYMIKQLVTGDNGASNEYSGSGVNTVTGTASAADGGIQVDKYIGFGDVTLISGTTIITVNGVPELVTTASDTNAAILSIPIPRDYDEASDHFIIRVLVALANADSGITLTGTPTILLPGNTAANSAGSAVTATLPFNTANAALSTTYQVVEINLSSNGLLRDNVIAVEIAYAGTTTGVGRIASLEYHYDSTIVSYNDTDTTGDDGTLAEDGNPLR